MNFSDADIQEFIVEATDLLEQAESNILDIAGGRDFKSHYDSAFRVFHSLKGGSGMLGLNALQKHMHAVENILSSLKTKQNFSQEECNFFLQSIDGARLLLAGQEIHFKYEIESQTKAESTAPTPKAEKPVLVPTSSVASSTPAPEAKRKIRGTTVIVDDEPDILEALSAMMEIAGFECLAFTDAHEAVEACKKNPPDVILTDLRMPKMSGLQFLAAIRKFNADVPVIIVSGFITAEALMDAIQRGVFSAVEKPFNQIALTNIALAALRQHQVYKMFRRGLHLLLYQFADLDDFLKANGKEDVAETTRNEINQLMEQWKTMNATSPLN